MDREHVKSKVFVNKNLGTKEKEKKTYLSNNTKCNNTLPPPLIPYHRRLVLLSVCDYLSQVPFFKNNCVYSALLIHGVSV